MAVATEAVGAQGTSLGYKLLPADLEYTPLGQLIETTGPQPEIAEIDTTKLSATFKTNMPSIPDPGELTLTVYAVQGDATIAAIQDLINSPRVIQWQLMASDGATPTSGSTQTFNGWVKSYQPKGYAIDSTPVADVTIRVTGLVVYAEGT